MRRWIQLWGLLVAVAVAAAACSGGATDTSVPATTAAPATTSDGMPALTTSPTSQSPTSQAPPATTATTAAPSTTSGATTTTAPTTTLGASEFVAIDISVEDSEVAGPGRVDVPLGSEIRLTVTSDETDEVHFHGYDIFADVAPDAPARMILVADIPGVFEVELEGAGLELVIVEVR